MKNSSRIYCALLLFVALGSVVDLVVEPYGPTAAAWNGFIQAFLLMLFIYRWEAVDAVERRCRRSWVARLVTIFLPPLGHGIYLLQSGEWKTAAWLFVRFWAGIVLTAVAAGLITALIIDPTSLTN